LKRKKEGYVTAAKRGADRGTNPLKGLKRKDGSRGFGFFLSLLPSDTNGRVVLYAV